MRLLVSNCFAAHEQVRGLDSICDIAALISVYWRIDSLLFDSAYDEVLDRPFLPRHLALHGLEVPVRMDRGMCLNAATYLPMLQRWKQRRVELALLIESLGSV